METGMKREDQLSRLLRIARATTRGRELRSRNEHAPFLKGQHPKADLRSVTKKVSSLTFVSAPSQSDLLSICNSCDANKPVASIVIFAIHNAGLSCSRPE